MGAISPLVAESPGMVKPGTRRGLKISLELPAEQLIEIVGLAGSFPLP
jgi:hypothetical protein